MTKLALTPEQKAASKRLKAQAAADAQMKARFEEETAAAKYKAELPKRMMDAQALALSLGVNVEIELTAIGPQVTFRCRNESDNQYVEKVIGYDTEEWELDYLERELQGLKKAQDEREQRRYFAQAAFSILTNEQKTCIKEFIHYLK